MAKWEKHTTTVVAKVATTPVWTEASQKVQPEPTNYWGFLSGDYWNLADEQLRQLVWGLHRKRPQSPQKRGVFSWAHHSMSGGAVHQALPQEVPENYPRPNTPPHQSVQPVTFREKVSTHQNHHKQAEKPFFLLFITSTVIYLSIFIYQ